MATSLGALRYREKMDRENKAKDRWHAKYGPALGLDSRGRRVAEVGKCATLETGTVAICICGGAMAAGEEPSEMLLIRLEKAMAEWWNGQSNSLIVSHAHCVEMFQIRCCFSARGLRAFDASFVCTAEQVTTGKQSAHIMKDILVAHGCPEVHHRRASSICGAMTCFWRKHHALNPIM